MRGEVVVGVEPHRLRRERGRERELVDLAVAGHEREAELAVDVERDRTSAASLGSTPRNSATPAMPGRSGVCTFSIGGASSAPARSVVRPAPRRAASTLAA